MTKKSEEILRLYASYDSLSLTDLCKLFKVPLTSVSSSLQWLFQHGYVKSADPDKPLFNGMYTVSAQLRITEFGRDALESAREHRRSYMTNEIRAWITLAIAVAAFVKSFFY